MMQWLRKRFPSVDSVVPGDRPTMTEDLQMAVRVQEALAAASKSAQQAAAHADEAQRLFGAIRREMVVARTRERQE